MGGEGLMGVASGRSSGSEGSSDLVELQSDSEDSESSVTEGDASKLGRMESCARPCDSMRLGGDVLRRKRPAR